MTLIGSLYTKGTRAHTHRGLIREWRWEPKGSSLEYIYLPSLVTYRFGHLESLLVEDKAVRQYDLVLGEREVVIVVPVVVVVIVMVRVHPVVCG